MNEPLGVSYGEGTRSVNQTKGLIRYLKRHNHTTPFEMVDFKFHLAMPIFVARQWMRHRTASINEYSARYSIVPDVFYTPELTDIRKQSTTNNQGRGEALDGDNIHSAESIFLGANESGYLDYQDLLELETAREIARNVLPVSVYTTFYWKLNLHNLLHFLGLRCDPHAQLEIRNYATAIAKLIKPIVPMAFEAWEDYDLYGERFSRQEMESLTALIQDGGNGYNVGNLQKRELDEFLLKISPNKDRVDFNLKENETITALEAEERFSGKAQTGQ